MRNNKKYKPDSSVEDFHQLLFDLTKEPVVDSRSENREARTLSLQVQPLDMDFRPDGPPFFAVTRDLSQNGLGFVNAEPFSHEHVRIAIPEHSNATAIGRVCYNLSVGVGQPLYLVGVQFISW